MTSARQVKLAECVDLLSGFAFKSQQFTDNREDVHLVKGENVSRGRVLWHISKRWLASEWEDFEKSQLHSDDVVIATDRPWVPAGLKWCFIRPHDPKVPRTDWKVLKDYPLVLPPKDLLSRFCSLLENSIAQQQNFIFRNQTLRQTRDLLLAKLLGNGH